tara:strand:- start:5296 stop:6804 length:1509 start_codon:yes stop_codon:yes gene_type:complete
VTDLKAINDTLEAQGEILENVEHNTEATNKGILGIFNEQRRSRLDTLEAQRETKEQGATVQRAAQSSAGESGGGLNIPGMLGLGALGSKLGQLFTLGMLTKLFKRGIIGGVITLLADEVGDYVKTLTGNDLAGALTEAGLVGGGIGYALFGPKGAVLGAIASAVVVASNKLTQYLEKELKDYSPDYNSVIAEALGAGTTIAAGAGVGFMVGGPLGAVVGAVVAGSAELVGMISRYKNDEKFRNQVDSIGARIESQLEKIMSNAGGVVTDFLAALGLPFLSSDEKNAFAEQFPDLQKELQDAQRRLGTEFAAKISQPGGISNLTQPELEEFRALTDRIAAIKRQRELFLTKSNEQLGITDEVLDFGMDDTSSNNVVDPGPAIKNAAQATVDAVSDVIADGNTGVMKIPGYIADLPMRAQENYLMQNQGLSPSDITKFKTLANEMNMGLIEYLEKTRTSGSTIVMDNSDRSTTGSSTTALVGSGTNALDMNNPILKRAMAGMGM